MAKKKKTASVEFRQFTPERGAKVYVQAGNDWIRQYGSYEEDMHFHNMMEIGICRRGSGKIVMGDRDYHYLSGCIMVIPENFPHKILSESENFWEFVFLDTRGVIRDMYPDNPVYQTELGDKLNRNAIMLDVGEEKTLYQLTNLIMDEAKVAREEGPKMMDYLAHGLTLELIRHQQGGFEGPAIDGKPLNMVQISPAVEYINQHYAEDLRVKEMSDCCKMSETHFRRQFETCYGMSPMDYVNMVRIQRACDLMRTTQMSMDEVAKACGYFTPSTFNRNFHKFMDESPYQWKINPDNNETILRKFNITGQNE